MDNVDPACHRAVYYCYQGDCGRLGELYKWGLVPCNISTIFPNTQCIRAFIVRTLRSTLVNARFLLEDNLLNDGGEKSKLVISAGLKDLSSSRRT